MTSLYKLKNVLSGKKLVKKTKKKGHLSEKDRIK